MRKRITIWIIMVIIFTAQCLAQINITTPRVKLGVDILEEEQTALLKGKRIGLITNQSGINGNMESTIDVIHRIPDAKLVCLFGPEHGIRGAAEAGATVGDMQDEKTGVPIYSLYGKTNAPTEKMLQDVDVLVYDIQDIGSRTYTYIWTMTESMRAAKQFNKQFIVLDRPNPINGLVVEGNLVEKKFESFIGKYPVAYCHGMTVGEMAKLANKEYNINCELTVIPMKNWKRWMSWKDTGLNWVPTSPHIPEADTPWYYPTTGIFGELKRINEGVGYTLPFKIVGSPKINAEALANELNSQNIPGVYFFPLYYRPFYGSKKDLDCQGVKIIITDFKRYQPVNTGYYIMAAIQEICPEAYEWDTNKRTGAFDKANGTDKIRKMIQDGKTAEEMIASWQKDLEQFKQLRSKYLIYE